MGEEEEDDEDKAEPTPKPALKKKSVAKKKTAAPKKLVSKKKPAPKAKNVRPTTLVRLSSRATAVLLLVRALSRVTRLALQVALETVSPLRKSTRLGRGKAAKR